MTAPGPPADLARRNPLFAHLAVGEFVHRFHTAKYEPPFFDRGLGGRLNAPNGKYGVLYTAKSLAGAFAETFLREPGRTLLAPDFLASKAYARLRVLRPLTLIKLGGPGLARLGATAELTHGGLPYDVPQAWSEALRAHPAKVDGIAYYARHDDEELCYALFERAPEPVEVAEREAVLDVDWFWRLADRYGVGLAP
ncbi:MAG: RES family NAD+ phosphorylase [Roseiarcus sp.]